MTYDYICGTCGALWEETQSISNAPIEICPGCGDRSARRQISGGAGFILKGGGWYADGYGKPKQKADT